jgi:flagellar export protein FliJ
MKASTLQRLLELRRHEEQRCRQELGLALAAEREAAAALIAVQRRLDSEREQLRAALAAGAVLPMRFVAWMEDLRVSERDVEQARVEVERRKKRVVEAEKTHDSARQAKRSLEKLDEKRREARERQLRRIEQKSLDEVGLRRFREQAEAASLANEETP